MALCVYLEMPSGHLCFWIIAFLIKIIPTQTHTHTVGPEFGLFSPPNTDEVIRLCSVFLCKHPFFFLQMSCFTLHKNIGCHGIALTFYVLYLY